MDIFTFARAAGEAMAKSRPNIFTPNDAARRVLSWVEELNGEPDGLAGTGGFMLYKHTEPDTNEVEFALVESVVDYTRYESGERGGYVWPRGKQLVSEDTVAKFADV